MSHFGSTSASGYYCYSMGCLTNVKTYSGDSYGNIDPFFISRMNTYNYGSAFSIDGPFFGVGNSINNTTITTVNVSYYTTEY